jgi:fructosamine-3-kinase
VNATGVNATGAVDESIEARLSQVLDRDVVTARSLGGQHGVSHYRLELGDGTVAFAKVHDTLNDRNGVAGRAAGTEAAAGFAAEAAGLRWLAAASAVPVPAVFGYNASCLIIEWVDASGPDPEAAVQFGRDLASLHRAGSEGFGAPWPGVIAGLELPNDPADNWADWYAANRVLPYARRGRDAGTLTNADVALIESACARALELAGPAEPPSRIHGDCWSGNVLWSGGRAWLIDPAAHGGHRETDLAMLALFGAPFLDRIMAAYQDAAPLADGWRARVPLHQLHPLVVHVCLFGSAYRDAALSAARHVLTA